MDKIKAYKRAEYSTTDQGKLIVLLYDGLVKAISEAIEAMKNKDALKAHMSLIKAQDIIAELMASIDLSRGDFAKKLYSLYDYMLWKLVDANIRKDTGPAEEVLEYVKELRQAWKEAAQKNPGITSNKYTEGGLNVQA